MTDDPDNADDLDDELELEPVDPEIAAHVKRRLTEKTRQAEAAVDLDEVYRETRQADPVNWETVQAFRFTTRHLLIVTALLAVVMTVGKLMGVCNALFISFVAAVLGGWLFTVRKERRQDREFTRRRQEVEARITAQRKGEEGEAPAPAPIETDINAAHAAAVIKDRSFDFRFSMKELIGAITVAAIMLTLVRWFGGPQQAALVLGLVALLGLAVHATGIDPPRIVVLGWWILLVLYLGIGMWAAVAG